MAETIRARYIGEYAVVLKDPGAVRDGEGKPLTSGIVNKGDILTMPASEVLGITYLASGGDGPLRLLGAGRVVLAEHKDLRDDELQDRGYQFHAGRSDFEVVTKKAAKEAEKPVILDTLPPVLPPAEAK